MKICDNCGCVMNENVDTCPNCGYYKNNQNTNGFEIPQESQHNSLDIPSQNDFQKINKKQDTNLQESPFKEVNPFEGLSYPVVNDLPKLKNESDIPDIVTRHSGIEQQNYFNYNSSTNNVPSSTPIKKREGSSIVGIVVIVLILTICGGIFLFKILSPNEAFDPNDNQKIKLTDVEEPTDTNKDKEEKPTEQDPNPDEQPSKDPSENPSEGEDSKAVNKTIGQFTLSIPSNYVISSYQDVGITITEPTNGRTMTFIQGVYDIGTYRSKREELIEQLETNGTKVSKTYNTVINNQDLYVMELVEEQVSYIMFIVPIKNTGKTLLVMAADYSNPHSFNYEIIKDALSIIETIK